MKLLTAARDLKRRKARERNTLFVTEGIRATEELLRSSIVVRGALVTAQLTETTRGATVAAAVRRAVGDVLEVSENELASAAQTDSPQGIVVLAEIPERELKGMRTGPGARVLILDGIQDPGNAGTLIRTAAAFGVSATIALPGTVDLWSAKVVRSAMGAQFNHLCVSSTWDETSRFLAEHGFDIWGTAADATLPSELPDAIALVLGNEGAGLTPEARSHVRHSIGIPMQGNVDSLNVAVAGGILLHHICH